MKSDIATFADLERAKGIPYSSPSDPWPLQGWYERVRTVPISQMPAGDVAIAVRQETWLPEVVERALAILEDDFLAGDIYEGELVAALAGLPGNFWEENPVLRSLSRQMLSEGLHLLDADVLEKIKPLVKLLAVS
jgi:hypothetical protein